MYLIGYSSYFTKIEQFKEGGEDNLNLLETSTNQDFNVVDELDNTNEGYQPQGR
jgi:hypothetical protein